MTKVYLPKATRSTTIRTFNGDGCTLEYLLDARDKSAGITPTLKSFFERGTIGHALIEADLNGEDADVIAFLYDEYFDRDNPIWDDEWIETTKCTKNGLSDEVDLIYATWQEQWKEIYDGFKVIGTEIELDFTTPNGTHVITTVDALLEDDEGYPTVVDWKLGTSKSGKDMQLYTYWYGLRRMGHVKDSLWFRGWFHYVNYKNPVSLTAGTYPGDEFVEAYIDASEERRKSLTFLPNPEWFSCRYCAHTEDCPIYAAEPVEEWNMIRELEVEI